MILQICHLNRVEHTETGKQMVGFWVKQVSGKSQHPSTPMKTQHIFGKSTSALSKAKLFLLSTQMGPDSQGITENM